MFDHDHSDCSHKIVKALPLMWMMCPLPNCITQSDMMQWKHWKRRYVKLSTLSECPVSINQLGGMSIITSVIECHLNQEIWVWQLTNNTVCPLSIILLSITTSVLGVKTVSTLIIEITREIPASPEASQNLRSPINFCLSHSAAPVLSANDREALSLRILMIGPNDRRKW